MNIETFNDDPNFSIVMPGGCNASCSFCFNREAPEFPTAPEAEYKKALTHALLNLGPQFYQVSITGGEPMTSPYLSTVLRVLNVLKEKYTNILLTTNGTGLLGRVDEVAETVDHINVSRHRFNEAENNAVFGGSYSMTDAELLEIIDRYGQKGVDISVNCVIDEHTTKGFIDQYINWGRSMGVYAIRFRKINGDLSPLPVEMEFSQYKSIWKGTCPVCYTCLKRIRGMDVFWKRSTLNPVETIRDKVFELVFEPNGKMYKDWNGAQPFELPNTPARQTRTSAGGSRPHIMIPPQNVQRVSSIEYLLRNMQSQRGTNRGGSGGSCGGSVSRC